MTAFLSILLWPTVSIWHCNEPKVGCELPQQVQRSAPALITSRDFGQKLGSSFAASITVAMAQSASATSAFSVVSSSCALRMAESFSSTHASSPYADSFRIRIPVSSSLIAQLKCSLTGGTKRGQVHGSILFCCAVASFGYAASPTEHRTEETLNCKLLIQVHSASYDDSSGVASSPVIDRTNQFQLLFFFVIVYGINLLSHLEFFACGLDLPSYRLLTMAPSNTVQPGFPSRLETQRLNEDLAAARKKLGEYENLFANLYCNACHNCKESFQRIADGSPVLHPATDAALVSSSSVYLRHASSPTTQNAWERLLQILRNYFPWPSTCQHGPTASQISAPESGSSYHVSLEQVLSSAGRSGLNVPTRPPQPNPSNSTSIQSNWVVKYDGFVEPTIQVKLEHVWTLGPAVGSVKFSPDGKCLAAGLGRGGEKTYIYDVNTRRKICVLQDRYAREKQVGVCILSFSPDGKYLATSQRNGRIPIWQVGKKHTRNAFRVRVDPSIPFDCADFSPDGRFLVSGSYRARARIWCLRDGTSIVLGDNLYYSAIAVKFSPDGKYVAASALDGMVFIWNVRSRRLVKKWKAHDQEVWGLVFKPDGKGLVTGGDMEVKYWGLNQPVSDDLEGALVFSGHTDAVASVAISSDGRWVASGSYDCTSRFWDIGGASVQCTLLGHGQFVQTVDFSPTGNYLACGSWDGKISMWRYESTIV